MKKTIYPFCIILFLTISCNSGGQNDAAKTLQGIQKVKAANTPGMVATSPDGYKMTAKINGKSWVASEMYPFSFESEDRVVGKSGEITISLPNLDNGYTEGQKIKIYENRAVDFFNEEGIWGGYTGQMQITKIGDKWVEGTFYFTATTSEDASKSLPVTDGFFRIPARD